MTNTALESLIQWDQSLFHKLNHIYTNSFLDWLLPVITDLHKLLPFNLAAIALLFIWFKKDKTKSLTCVALLIATLFASDLVANRSVKLNVKRPRPEFALSTVDLKTHSHSGYSFPSNHAANNAAVAVILISFFPKIWFVFVGIALLIAYSRVYVGVHFPLDAIAGLLIGAGVGLAVLQIKPKLTIQIQKLVLRFQ